MATINQLVRKPRVKSVPKNKVPALEACLPCAFNQRLRSYLLHRW